MKLWWMLSIFLLTCPDQVDAGVYNLRLTTDNGPDCTDLESLVRTITQGCETPQDKCIAIWSWARRSRRQTSNAHEDGRLIWDPILHYNSYGTMNCGVVSGLNIACFLQLGYQARYVQLGDHTVSEVSWNDGRSWHLLDSSMSYFCYNHEGVIASCEEIKQAHGCELSRGLSEPGHFYLYHGAPQCRSHLGPAAWRCASDQPVVYERTLANGAASYTDGFSVSQYTQYGRSGHRYILNLLPGQSYTRYFRPLDRDNPDVSAADRPDYYRPLRDGDPDDQHGLHNIRGNGIWEFQLDLDDAASRNAFYDDQNLAPHDSLAAGLHLHPAEVNCTAFVVLNVSAANVITALRVHAEGLRAAPGDTLRILVSRTAGLQWQQVWQSDSLGRQEVDLRLRDEVAGVTQCLVKFEMLAVERPVDVGLEAIRLKAITQLNRRTLPTLALGTNRVRLSADEQLESTVLWPVLHANRYRETVWKEDGVHSSEQPDGIYKATIGSADNGRECHATWRLTVPSDIVDVTYGVVATNRSSASYVALGHSFDGQRFEELFRKSDGSFPFDQQVLRTVSAMDTMPGREAWLRCAFFSRGGAATYGMDGVQDVMIRVRHKPRDVTFQPIEVTYNWTEHRKAGDVTRSHTELVSQLPHVYTINTAGFRDPTMNWVRLNLREDNVAESSHTYGYSDGEDVGTQHEPLKCRYEWGRNVAAGRPYTTSRPAEEASRNGDQDAAELTNEVIIAPTDVTAHEMVQAATALWSAGEPVTFVVDLGEPQLVVGTRISTHQPNGNYCHPASVDVSLSADGHSWHASGTIQHDDLFCPPFDYEPWEHDDNPRYDALPAAGRLAYSFPLVFARPRAARWVRFTFTPLAGRGLGISELQVFDRAFKLVDRAWDEFEESARSPRIQAAKMPQITAPVMFCTPEADAICSALEVFPADNPWNTPIEDWPVHPGSDAIIASIGREKPLRCNMDMAFILVPPDQPRVEVKIVGYPAESDPGPFPVPDDVPIEGWPVTEERYQQRVQTLAQVQQRPPAYGGDRHAIVVDPVNRMLYEFFVFGRDGGSWVADQASVFDLKTNELRPAGWTSADAAGLPIFPAVVRYDELERGLVEHALRVTVRNTRRAFVAPATHFASRYDNPAYPRMGERIRLKADYDVSGFTPPVQAILKGLKKYGMFVADNGIEWAISVAPDPRIPDLHAELRRVRGTSFEVVRSPHGEYPEPAERRTRSAGDR